MRPCSGAILSILFIFLFPAVQFGQEICFPTLTPAENITVSCGEPLPEFSSCEGSTECCAPLTVESIVSETGNVEQACVLSTAFGPGPDWAFWLPDIDSQNVSWRFEDNGQFEEYGDGTAHLWGIIYKVSDPSLRMEAHLWMQNGRNWEEWSALGRGYKDDFNLAGTNYIDWSYYELTEGFAWLNGLDELEGSQLMLTHKPANYYFGFQAGVGANNKNSNEGLSGWFDYTGWFNGEWVTGHGDVNVDRACTAGPEGCASTAFTQICRATNACSASAFASQTISSLDTEAPLIVSFEAEVTQDCFDPTIQYPEAIDNCSEVNITFTDEIITPGCGGSFIRHYTVADGCGNSVLLDQLVTLTGGEPEFTSFPPDVSVECNEIPSSGSPLVQFTPGCANTILTVEETIIEGSCAGNFVIERLYILTDDCGNEVTQLWTIEVQDNTAPVLFNIPADFSIFCGDPIPDALVFSIDNCDSEAGVGVSATTIQLECGYQFIRTWFAEDACGNTSSSSQTITVLDDQAPVFEFVPENATVECGTEVEITPAIAVDACSLVTLTTSDVMLEEGCSGSFIRTYTATDGCGNSASVSHTIFFIDDSAPVFTSFPVDAQVSCSAIPSAEEAEISFEDNCGDVTSSFSETIIEGDCPGDRIIERTWTISDDCGNTESNTWTLTVVDNEAPQLFGVPADQSLNCGEEPADAVVIAIDNCSAEPLVGLSATTLPAECGYQFVRTWTAIDDCGNETSLSQTITFIDTESPVFVFVPENAEVTCGEEFPNGEAIAEDACSDVTVTFSDIPSADCIGGITRVFTATDGCGNSVSAEQILTYVDNEAPIIAVFPQNITVDCTQIPAIENVEVQFIDACSTVSVEYAEIITPGVCEGYFQIARTWMATDACGNSTTATWIIEVADNQGPEIVGDFASVTFECGEIAPLPEVNATDFCSGLSEINLLEEEVELSCGYQVIRTWTAVDFCGNISIAQQVVTFEDTTDPVFLEFPESITISCGDPIPPIEMPAAFDSCIGEIPTLFAEETFPAGCAGSIITRVFRAFDDCGNQAIFFQTITIIDDEAPIFSGEAIISRPCGDFNGTYVTAVDDCNSSVSITYLDVPTNDGAGCAGSITRTYTAADECGNLSTFVQIITLQDEISPSFTSFPDDVIVSCGQIPSTDTDQIQYSDNCGTPAISVEEIQSKGECANSYQITRTYTLSDACGNSAVQTWTIQVTDDLGPVLLGVPANTTIGCNDPIPDAFVFAIDNCSGNTPVGVTAVTEETECGLVFTRTWFSIDDCGNTSEATQVITSGDINPPQLSEYPENVVIPCGDPLPPLPFITAFDECIGDLNVDFQEEITGGLDCEEIYLRTWCTVNCSGVSTCWTQTISFSSTDGFMLAPSSISGGQVTMNLRTSKSGRTDLTVYSTAGQIVQQPFSGHLEAGEKYQIDLETSSWAPGIYLIQMRQGDWVVTYSLPIIE